MDRRGEGRVDDLEQAAGPDHREVVARGGPGRVPRRAVVEFEARRKGRHGQERGVRVRVEGRLVGGVVPREAERRRRHGAAARAPRIVDEGRVEARGRAGAKSQVRERGRRVVHGERAELPGQRPAGAVEAHVDETRRLVAVGPKVLAAPALGRQRHGAARGDERRVVPEQRRCAIHDRRERRRRAADGVAAAPQARAKFFVDRRVGAELAERVDERRAAVGDAGGEALRRPDAVHDGADAVDAGGGRRALDDAREAAGERQRRA